MCILFITEQGSKITKESRRIYLEKDDVELFEIQTRKISSLIVMGNVQVTTPALALLADDGLSVTYLSMDGKIKGEFLPAVKKNLHIKSAQYEAAADQDVSFDIARGLVSEKIENTMRFYRKLQKNESIENIRYLINTLEEAKNDAENARSYSELLGIEGAASRLHFSNYGAFFKNELTFSVRSKYPPVDEVNAILSLGYTMLFNLICGLTHGSGLDIYKGFLHKDKYNRPSLCCDIEEIFRTKFIDSFVLKMSNLGMLKLKDFEERDGGVYLTKEGLNIFFTQWKQLAYPFNGSELVSEIMATIETLIRKINLFISVEEEKCS